MREAAAARRILGSVKRALAVTVALLTVTSAFSLPITGAAYAAESVAPALQEYGSCLTSQRQGDLLVVIDQSGSLRDTDPANARVTAAKFLLGRLTRFTTKAHVKLTVAISGFDAGYSNVADWTDLSPGSVPTMLAAVDGFAAKNTGFETDYWSALDGARQALRSRVAASGEASRRCQALIFLTDGKFDLGVHSADKPLRIAKPFAPGLKLDDAASVAKAEALGRTDMCRTGGLVDQLRAGSVKTFAIGLGSPDTGSDFGLLRSIATGSDGAQRCGTASKAAPGAFFQAGALDDLLFVFDKLGDPNEVTIDEVSGVCAKRACADQAHMFVLDQSIRQVQILAGADADGVQILLTAPGVQTPLVLSPGPIGVPTSASIGTDDVDVEWQSARTVAITAALPANAWTGQWSVVFVDKDGTHPKARSRTQIRIAGDLKPVLVDRDALHLRSGDTATGIQFGVAHQPDGAPIDLKEILGTLVFSADLVLTDGKTVPIAASLTKEALATPRSLDLAGLPPGRATVRMKLSVTTASVAAFPGGPTVAGSLLADEVAETTVDVQSPPNFPTVPDSINFGQGKVGATKLRGSVPVTGPGCVWLVSATVTTAPQAKAPPSVGADSAKDPGSCVSVRTDAVLPLPVSLAISESGTGTVNGQFTVALAPIGEPDRRILKNVVFAGDFRKPVDTVRRTWVLSIALLIGLGLPLLMLYALKWWSARMPPVGLRVGSVQVEVHDGVVTREGAPAVVTHADTRYLAINKGGQRELTMPASSITLRARAGLNPVLPGHVEVVAPGLASASSVSPHTDRSGKRALLPLAIHNKWVVLHSPGTSQHTVLLLVSADADARVYQRITAEILAELPARAAALVAASGGTVERSEPGPDGAGGWFDDDGAAATDASPDSRDGGGGWFT